MQKAILDYEDVQNNYANSYAKKKKRKKKKINKKKKKKQQQQCTHLKQSVCQ